MPHTATEIVHVEEASEQRLGKFVNADSLGILAAIICLVHCLALPVMAIALPSMAAGSSHEDLTHYVLAGFVALFCVFAILPGYKKHKNNDVLLGMLSGMSLVLFATFVAAPAFGEVWEIPLITIGNLLVVFAHLRNRKLLLASTCCR